MRVDSVKNGVVIDHITNGKAMQIYSLLNLDNLDCTVAILRNVPSRKMGKKDIIKIDCNMDINFDVLGFISPNITVDVIRDGKVVEKKHIDLPERLTDILECKNPRCITSTEQDIHHISRLTDRENGVYRCIYCDSKSN
ncbi:MAG: aspartate carbamoyltransferase regulatory subunit [Acutalibacteraceae bacterium]|nr:aspartate carbamoyltransferase regulatory subunit [Clostridia bacterium]MBQ2318884.1 aspartate carbamoyltransferase regulatory subunit [Clostridia bacterium]MBQ2420726.1 aspartate carbamoyltransferase regulatory subunit [Clostridia bacterium]MEE1127744.1 aspartate carbamoyltransferase regulatory subunit [Acutalibacteraceae bacterium]